MSRDKINVLTGDLMGFFSNNSKSLYNYLKQREMTTQQEVLYTDTNRAFRAICLSFYELNTPAMQTALSSTPAPKSATPGIVAGATTTAGVSTVGNNHSSAENAKMSEMSLYEVERMTVRIRFIGQDSFRNGFLTEDPLASNISRSRRKAIIEMHPSATLIDPNHGQPNHQDILLVRQDKEGKYYIDKVLGNMNGIIPQSFLSIQSAVWQGPLLPGSNMGNYAGAPTVLGANQALHYRTQNREAEGKIDLIVLHSTAGWSGAGRAQRCISYFAGPMGPTRSWKDSRGKKSPPCTDYPRGWPLRDKKNREIICHRGILVTRAISSVHYATDSGGAIVQGCLDKDMAHHAGHGGANRRGIGIEMCGRPNEFAGEGAGGKYSKMYDDVLLETTAKLCAHLCRKHNIPVKFASGKEPAGKGLAGHEQFTPKERCDPGWILNSKENSALLGNPNWHTSKWREKDVAKRHRAAGIKAGDIKHPEGNYWDWDDFTARVQKHYDAGTTINISGAPPAAASSTSTITQNPAASSPQEPERIITEDEAIIEAVTSGDIVISPGREWMDESGRVYQLDGDFNKVYLDEL